MESQTYARRLWLGTVFQCLRTHALGRSALRFSKFIQGVGEEGMGLEIIGLRTFWLL
jgi:hypothetical protein